MPLPATGVNDRLDDIKVLLAATNTALGDINGNLTTIAYNSAFLPTIQGDMTATRIAIAPSGEDLPSGAKSSVAWSLWRLMDAVAPAYPRTDLVPLLEAFEAFNQLYQAVNGVPTEDGTSILTGIIALIDNIGLPTGDATTTALGLLASIARSSLCGCPPGPPAADDPAGCATPEVSIGMLALSTYPGVNFATWTRPIFDGASFVDTFDPTIAEDIEIELSADFSGWKVYVQSSAETFAFSPATGSRYPTNTWLEPPNEALAINVDSAHTLTVYICVPASVAPCANFDSESITSTATGGGSSTAATIDMSTVALTDASTTANISGTTYTGSAPMFAHSNGHGWQITVVTNDSGLPIRIGTTGTDDSFSAATISTVGASHTIDRDTHAWWIDRAFDVSPATAPYTVEICRAE